MHGGGTLEYANGDVYQGQWVKNERSGFGKLTFKRGGEYFNGEWLEDKMHGKGTFTHSNGVKQDGIWENGVLLGPKPLKLKERSERPVLLKIISYPVVADSAYQNMENVEPTKRNNDFKYNPPNKAPNF